MASVAVTMTHDGKGINTSHKTSFRTINQRDVGATCVPAQAAFLTVIVPIRFYKISLQPNTPGPAWHEANAWPPTQPPTHITLTMHPPDEDSHLISGEGPVNLRTASRQKPSVDASRQDPSSPLRERIERVHTRNRFGVSLVEHLSVTRVATQKPASGAQIAWGVLAACGGVLVLLGAIQSLTVLMATGVAIAGCGALGWKIVHDRSRTAELSGVGAPPPFLLDAVSLAAFDAALEKSAAQLDEENATRLLTIKDAFKRMGNQVAAHDEHFTVEDRMYLRECLRRYVPDSVQAYLRVPAAQRNEALLNDQPCAQIALLLQLDLLLEEIRLREKKLGRSAAEVLARQQRFLASKKSR